MQNFDIAFLKIPRNGILRNNLDSTIRGIARKSPDKKCRCTIDTKGAENHSVRLGIVFRKPKNKKSRASGQPYAKNARAIRFALKD